MKIIWTDLSLKRLENIVDFIALDNKQAAEKFAIKLFSKVDKLSLQPEMGRKITGLDRNDIREIIEGSFRVIYRIEEKRISILTVRHIRRVLDYSELK